MNDYRGLLIKKRRKELDISLEALSHGICSPSYLSKIENNILVANDDIYNLLFKKLGIATVYKGNIIKNLIMDCQSYTKYRPNETTGGIFVSWRRKEELSTGT